MSNFIRNVVAIIVGVVISPLVALACAVIVFFASFLDFWRGLLITMKANNTPQNNQTKELTVWEKHIAKLDAQNKNTNSGE